MQLIMHKQTQVKPTNETIKYKSKHCFFWFKISFNLYIWHLGSKRGQIPHYNMTSEHKLFCSNML